MNKNSLHKVIESFILPKYPWIDSFSISLYSDTPSQKYSVRYYVKPEDDGMFTVTEEMNKVEELTYTLFMMLGPDKGQFLNEVIFLIKQ
jgi:hypothetical protein